MAEGGEGGGEATCEVVEEVCGELVAMFEQRTIEDDEVEPTVALVGAQDIVWYALAEQRAAQREVGLEHCEMERVESLCQRWVLAVEVASAASSHLA